MWYGYSSDAPTDHEIPHAMGASFAFALLVLLLSGCAGLSTGSVPNHESDLLVGGIRYYQPARYLLLYTNSEGGFVSKLLILPDLHQKMSIRPYAIAAKNDTTLTFTNGMLDTAKAVIDQTEVPKAVIVSLEKAAAAAIKAKGKGAFLAPGEEAPSVPAPYLFKIVNTGDGWELVGGQGKDEQGNPVMIKVKVSNPAQ
jgi:hypothetical protein